MVTLSRASFFLLGSSVLSGGVLSQLPLPEHSFLVLGAAPISWFFLVACNALESMDGAFFLLYVPAFSILVSRLVQTGVEALNTALVEGCAC